MLNQNAYFTNRMAEMRRQQSWDAFCQSGSVPDYLQYRSCCEELEVETHADASDGQGAGDP